jgi:hypothetical protein
MEEMFLKALSPALSAFTWVPPAKLFGKFSRRALINSWLGLRGIGTVTGFPMDLGFRMFFPDLDFRIRFASLGLIRFRRIWIGV